MTESSCPACNSEGVTQEVQTTESPMTTVSKKKERKRHQKKLAKAQRKAKRASLTSAEANRRKAKRILRSACFERRKRGNTRAAERKVRSVRVVLFIDRSWLSEARAALCSEIRRMSGHKASEKSEITDVEAESVGIVIDRSTAVNFSITKRANIALYQ